MIDTDKMKTAFAATPLCQMQWTQKGANGGATKLCAISALVSFAGVQPELIHKMSATEDQTVWLQSGFALGSVPAWVAHLALPVLRAEYGIPRDVGVQFPPIFDKQENEWQGVVEVLALCERHNAEEMYVEALGEDAVRFPQHGPDMAHTGMLRFSDGGVFSLTQFGADYGYTIAPHKAEKVSLLPAKMKPGQSKFWTASKAPEIKKLVAL